MTLRFLAVGVAAVLGAVLAGAAGAHHSFAMFDNDRLAMVTGTVKSVDYTNPHSWVYLTGDDAKDYTFEAGSPNQLMRKGWMKNTVKPGDKITVSMHPLKSGEPGGSVQKIAFADGRSLDGR